MAAKRGKKLSKAQRAEISRKNLRKAFRARGVKATFEPAGEPRRRRAKKARRVAEPARKQRRRVAQPSPAFVFEPARKRAPARRKRAPMYRAYDPARLSKEERMRKMALGMLKNRGTVLPHMMKYLTPEDMAMVGTGPTLMLPAAKRRAGRPRKPTAQLKKPRRAKKATGTAKRRAGRPRMPTAMLKHPRKAAPIKRRKVRSSSAGRIVGGAGKGIIRSGVYSSKGTGQVIAIRRVYSQKNPVWETKHLAAGAGGLVLGIISADLLDRFIATMAVDKGGAALNDRKAIAAIQSKVNAARMATSAGGAVVGFGSAYLLRKKSPIASYALGGFGLGFGVKFLTQLVTDVLMPVIFKVEDRTKDTYANRMYPDKQGYSDISTTTAPPASKNNNPPGTQAGVGRPKVYRLPAPRNQAMLRPGQIRGAMPDFGPVATRHVSGAVGSCQGCGGSSCASNSCNYPFERYGGTPAGASGMSPIPESANVGVPQPVSPSATPQPVSPLPNAFQSQAIQMAQIPNVQRAIEVDVNAAGQLVSQFSQEQAQANAQMAGQANAQLTSLFGVQGVTSKADVVALMNRASNSGGNRRHYN